MAEAPFKAKGIIDLHGKDLWCIVTTEVAQARALHDSAHQLMILMPLQHLLAADICQWLLFPLEDGWKHLPVVRGR